MQVTELLRIPTDVVVIKNFVLIEEPLLYNACIFLTFNRMCKMKKSRYFGSCKGFAIAGALLMGIGSASASQNGAQEGASDKMYSCNSVHNWAMGELLEQQASAKEEQEEFFQGVDYATSVAKQVATRFYELLSSPDSTEVKKLDGLLCELQALVERLKNDEKELQQKSNENVVYLQGVAELLKKFEANQILNMVKGLVDKFLTLRVDTQKDFEDAHEKMQLLDKEIEKCKTAREKLPN
jgi:hemerythrin-like domain-containing protein